MSHSTNYAIYTIWTDEEFDEILKTKGADKNPANESILYRNIAFTEKSFEWLNFEEKILYTSDRTAALSEALGDEFLEHLQKIGGRSRVRAWFFDLKKLYWFNIVESEYKAIIELENIKCFSKFSELEEFAENHKHRFASKKFGL
jgi:hypothetical protein